MPPSSLRTVARMEGGEVEVAPDDKEQFERLLS